MAFFRARTSPVNTSNWNAVAAQPQAQFVNNKPTLASLGGAAQPMPPMPTGNMQVGGGGWTGLNAPYIGQPGTVMGQPMQPAAPTVNAPSAPMQGNSNFQNRMLTGNPWIMRMFFNMIQNNPQMANMFKNSGMFSRYNGNGAPVNNNGMMGLWRNEYDNKAYLPSIPTPMTSI